MHIKNQLKSAWRASDWKIVLARLVLTARAYKSRPNAGRGSRPQLSNHFNNIKQRREAAESTDGRRLSE